MKYSLTLNTIGEEFSIGIEADTPMELMQAYEQLGGSKAFLVETVKGAIMQRQTNEATSAVQVGLGANPTPPVAAGAAPTVAQPAATMQPTVASPTFSSAPVAQPSPSGASANADPWGASPDPTASTVAATPSAQATAPLSEPTGVVDPWATQATAAVQIAAPVQSGASPMGPAVAGAQAIVSTDKFGREWTVGLSDAPLCQHNIPAARLKAKSQAGKWYTAWKCSYGAGENYQAKCEFNEFVAR